MIFTVAEYAGNLTEQTRVTLEYLVKNKYLTAEQYDDLSSRLVVATVKNEKTFGKRILERFFRKEDSTNMYVFPIVSIDHAIVTSDTPRNGKPKLKLIDTQNDIENS